MFYVCVFPRSDVHAEIAVYVSAVNGTGGVFLALRVDQGGCTTFLAKGLFFWILIPSRTFQITRDLSKSLFVNWHSLLYIYKKVYAG